jgi:predicted pyridoxine 5'-phosphate oxidase superfamily flavin-nucleotide-binding protein
MNAPANATHFFDGQYYMFVGTYTKNGNPNFVRWIKCRNDWAKVPQAYAIKDEHKI